MCGRYASHLPAAAIARRFRTTGPLPNIAPSWNVAPTQSAPVVRRHPETGERRLDLLTWGFLPHWAQDPKAAARRPINARAEAVATAPMWRDAFGRQRYLVPADAFYEWKARYEWKTRDGGKQPWATGRAGQERPLMPGPSRRGALGPPTQRGRDLVMAQACSNRRMHV